MRGMNYRQILAGPLTFSQPYYSSLFFNMDLEQRWKDLCAQAAVEKDPVKLSQLVSEIMRLIDLQQKRAKNIAVEQRREEEGKPST